MSHRINLCIASIVLLLAGCSNRPGPGPLAPDYHYQANPRGTDEARHVLVDRTEKLYDSVSYDLLNPGGIELIPQEAPPRNSVTVVSPTASDEAREQMEPAPGAPATLPSTRPSASRKTVTNGTYGIIGGVVVQ